MSLGVRSQWSEIGVNGVETANNGNRWQPVVSTIKFVLANWLTLHAQPAPDSDVFLHGKLSRVVNEGHATVFRWSPFRFTFALTQFARVR